MSYTVIHAFTDLQDHNHVYLVGDGFPHDNTQVSEERIKELLGSSNKIGEPLIKKDDSDFSNYMNPPEEYELPFTTVPSKKYTKTEINRLSTSELRELAKENGVDNADEITGAELKKILIEKFGL